MAERRIIKNELPDDYYLVGIVTALREYQFGYRLNKIIACDFIKLEDHAVQRNKAHGMAKFSVFRASVNERETTYFIFANKNEQGDCLLPEASKFDYLLQVFGRCDEEGMRKLVAAVDSLSEVILAIPIRQLKDRSRERLIYHEEELNAKSLTRRIKK